jgi:hypothetical protein
MTDIKHTRADEVKPGRREITVANAIDIVHDDITFDAIHGTKSKKNDKNRIWIR